MKKFVRENALTLVMMALFVACLVGQIVTGRGAYNHEAAQDGRPVLGLAAYVTSGHFIEALFENWESEFLQMGIFVVLTKFLKQRGSSESKKPGEHSAVDDDPKKHANDPRAPWPVRKGGVVLALYEHSLSLALFALFLGSFVLHARAGARAMSEEELARGGGAISTFGYLATPHFWFESFQNWQSEFLSVATLVVLSIFLRERGSAQSKPVARAHGATEE